MSHLVFHIVKLYIDVVKLYISFYKLLFFPLKCIFEVYLCCCVLLPFSHFHYSLVFYCMHIWKSLHSSAERHWGCFQAFDTNNAPTIPVLAPVSTIHVLDGSWWFEPFLFSLSPWDPSLINTPNEWLGLFLFQEFMIHKSGYLSVRQYVGLPQGF